jgi:hypothetical protein
VKAHATIAILGLTLFAVVWLAGLPVASGVPGTPCEVFPAQQCLNGTGCSDPNSCRIPFADGEPYTCCTGGTTHCCQYWCQNLTCPEQCWYHGSVESWLIDCPSDYVGIDRTLGSGYQYQNESEKCATPPGTCVPKAGGPG